MSAGALSIRSVTREQYLEFRQVGIAGHLLDGTFDVDGFNGVTPLRNALFCDLLVTTGMRRAEASHLTMLDLPHFDTDALFSNGHLPPRICKGDKTRPWKLPRQWMSHLAIFHRSEWHDMVRLLQPRLKTMLHRGELLVATEYEGQKIRFGKPRSAGGFDTLAKQVTVKNLSKDRRSRLVLTPEVAALAGLPKVPAGWLVPACIFPGASAPSVAPDGWSAVFLNANLRVNVLRSAASLPPTKRVTPHMLRHTFAINYLRGQLEVLRAQTTFAQSKDFASLQKTLMNPLLDVQRLLGHSQMETTLLYLREIATADEEAEAAMGSWIERFLEEGSA